MNENMKIIDSVWFNGTIGLVLAQNDLGEYRAFLGTGNGLNKQADEMYIVDWGCKFRLEAAAHFFGCLNTTPAQISDGDLVSECVKRGLLKISEA